MFEEIQGEDLFEEAQAAVLEMNSRGLDHCPCGTGYSPWQFISYGKVWEIKCFGMQIIISDEWMKNDEQDTILSELEREWEDFKEWVSTWPGEEEEKPKKKIIPEDGYSLA